MNAISLCAKVTTRASNLHAKTFSRIQIVVMSTLITVDHMALTILSIKDQLQNEERMLF